MLGLLVRFVKKMVRCSAVTNKGRRCKLHRAEGSETCAMHGRFEPVAPAPAPVAAPAPALVISEAENTIIQASVVDISGNAFSDASGNTFTKGIAHNPHYYEWQRKQNNSEPPSQKYLLKVKKAAQEQWAATNTEKLCGHLCDDTKKIQCCACSDKRPCDTKYTHKVDGLGEISWLREDTYCTPCRKKYKTETLPHVAQYNLVMENTEFNGPALGNYGFQVCKDIEDSIQGLLTMHNTLYERCISLALISRIDTLDTQQETVLHP